MSPQGFHGRAEELAWLRGQWDACTARDPATGRFTGGPRAAFILAESGIGKSRLVQALYQQLTTDPAWDPPEVNYWPDAFNDQGVQLRVVPSMEGHVAKGPPRFAWLGARWQPTDVRNVSDRRSALPELRHSIMVHAEILRRQGSAWQDATGRIRDAIRRDGPRSVAQAEDAAEVKIPSDVDRSRLRASLFMWRLTGGRVAVLAAIEGAGLHGGKGWAAHVRLLLPEGAVKERLATPPSERPATAG